MDSIRFRNLTLNVLEETGGGLQTPLLVLGHGANGGMRHPLLEEAAEGFVRQGFTILRFNFPYQQEGKNSPNSDPVLIEVWSSVLAAIGSEYPGRPVFIGGKSLGGRTAAAALDSFGKGQVLGLVFLGFPLHAPGRPGITRGVFLKDLALPCFFAQGTRDNLAAPDLIRTLAAGIPDSAVRFVDRGDHSLRSGETIEGLWEEIALWIQGIISKSKPL